MAPDPKVAETIQKIKLLRQKHHGLSLYASKTIVEAIDPADLCALMGKNDPIDQPHPLRRTLTESEIQADKDRLIKMKRDQFASHALIGLITRNWKVEEKGDEKIIEQWGVSAFLVADSMLKAGGYV